MFVDRGRRGRHGQSQSRAAIRLRHDAAGLPRHAAVRGIEGLTNPRGFITRRQAPAQREIPERLRRRGLRRHPAGRARPRSPVGRAEDRLHDRVDGDGHRRQYRGPARRQGAARGRPGTPSAWPISATRASPSWRCRRSRRATSTGRARANGFTPPRSASRSTSCARSAREASETFYEKFALRLMGIEKLVSAPPPQ